MKKSELTQLTQIIEHLVAKEVRKQLPTVIAEVFQNMIGKKVVSEEKQPKQQVVQEQIEPQEEEMNLKASLREIFSGTSVMREPKEVQSFQPKQYTKNPVLNEILNETTNDLRSRERMVGMAAFQGGYAPSMAGVPMTGPGQMMAPIEEPSFGRNMPVMTPSISTKPIATRPPVILAEGQESTHAPLSELPAGVSALDVAKAVPGVGQALTRNYSEMMKLIDKKKGKKV